ncbi:MAG: TetR/AcrR family transcriptional regulator [Pseudomonadota bacterium]
MKTSANKKSMNAPVEESAAPADKSVTKKVPRGKARRRLIYRSLHDCILEKGYVKTTLADIAEGAGMSASHLLYYFKGKEAILESYFERVSERFLERIDGFRDQSTQDQIQSLADFWFKGEASTRQEIGFMLECFGAAVNDKELQKTKAQFDIHCKQYLSDLVSHGPSLALGSADDTAEVAYAVMIGLRSAVYFDEGVKLEDAHRLFINSIRAMCGMR